MSVPRVRAYPKETVVSEKLQSTVHLGILNSRMKDFFDLYWLCILFPFDGSVILEAIQATFKRRKTDIPAQLPLALSDEFSSDPVKQTQWKAFLNKNDIKNVSKNLPEVIAKLREFLYPPLKAAADREPFSLSWHQGGPWQH